MRWGQPEDERGPIGPGCRKTIIALSGMLTGAQLLRQWQQSRSRVVSHWVVFFLAAVGYLFGLLRLLGWGDAATMKPWQYVLSAAAVLPGALSGMVLMLPLSRRLTDPLSLYLPLALFAIVSLLLLTRPVQPGSVTQGAAYSGQFATFHLATLIGTGLFAAGTLVYPAVTLRNVSHIALAVAFLLTTGGLRMMGGQVLSVALGMGLVVAAHAVF